MMIARPRPPHHHSGATPPFLADERRRDGRLERRSDLTNRRGARPDETCIAF
jgi:hypothetical protein